MLRSSSKHPQPKEAYFTTMMATNDLKSAGVLRRGPIRLKLYVMGLARATPDVDANLIRLLTNGLAIDPAPDQPLAGFLLLSPQANAVWRCPS
jgi:hypothetical protein